MGEDNRSLYLKSAHALYKIIIKRGRGGALPFQSTVRMSSAKDSAAPFGSSDP